MIYFKQIINILQSQKWYGKSEVIEIAKGKYELPTSYGGVLCKFKRGAKWLLRK